MKKTLWLIRHPLFHSDVYVSRSKPHIRKKDRSVTSSSGVPLEYDLCYEGAKKFLGINLEPGKKVKLTFEVEV